MNWLLIRTTYDSNFTNNIPIKCMEHLSYMIWVVETCYKITCFLVETCNLMSWSMR